MITEIKEIKCIKCGELDKLEYSHSPEDDLEKIICETSESLFKTSVCDKCKEKAEIEWRERTQVFETGSNEFSIPKQHTDYDRNKASDIGQKLARAIFDNNNQHLYIQGQYDIGKSKAVCSVGVWLMSNKSKKVNYVAFNDVMSHYSSIACTQSKVKADEYLKSLLKCDVLIIDDFCKKRLTWSNCEATYQLAEYIYTHDHNCKVWITANFGQQKAMQKWEDDDLALATFSRFKRCGFMYWDNNLMKFALS